MLFDHTYHPDHLGGAAWITDKSGFPVQYLHYASYGEMVANQQTTGYDERFKFTGKERDAETGFDYFGARSYWSLGFWTSIDPVEGKDKKIDNILDPQLMIDIDNNLYWGGELPEIVVFSSSEL